MSSSGESAVVGKLLSGTEVAKYVLISFIYVYKLINDLCLHFAPNCYILVISAIINPRCDTDVLIYYYC